MGPVTERPRSSTRRRGPTLALPAIALLFVGLLATPIEALASNGILPEGLSDADDAPVTRCEGGRIVVIGDVGRDAQLECAAATHACELMASFGATVPHTLTVELVGSIDEREPQGFAGAYDTDGARIRVLDEAGFLSQADYFGLPTTLTLHGAIVAHEVSHAIVDAHVERASATALEYVGAVVAMTWLAPNERQALMDAWPTAGYRSEDEISIVYYALSPARFQVKVWKHYRQADVGAAFIADILAGRALRHDGGDL